MKNYKIISWNVNGIRAVSKKGFFDFLEKEKADIYCLQETKAQEEQLSEDLTSIKNHYSYFFSAEKKGYSGVALFLKEEPVKVKNGLGKDKFDIEGRVIEVEMADFRLFNIYFPNGKRSEERLKYKMDFYEYFGEYMKKLLERGEKIVVCGDVNTAHKEMDLARPRENENVSGFLPQERKWIDKFLDLGFIDSFRFFQPEKEEYSWWSYRTRARERNIGWRLDYFFVSDNLRKAIKKAYILTEVEGSDHCPVGLELQI